MNLARLILGLKKVRNHLGGIMISLYSKGKLINFGVD